MRRFFCVAVLLVLLFCLPAEAENKKILFRGLAWGAEYADVINALNNDGLSMGRRFDIKYKSMAAIIKDSYDFVDFPVGYYFQTDYKSGDVYVAGQKVEALYLYFAYTDQEQTPDAARLIGAKYKFKPANVETFRDGFVRKLCSLYGDEYQREEEHFIFDIAWHTWTDAAGNAVCLQTKTYDPYAVKDVYLWYSSGASGELMQKAYELKKAYETEKEIKKLLEEDVSGL